MVHHRSRYTVQRSTFLRSRSTVQCTAKYILPTTDRCTQFAVHRWYITGHSTLYYRSRQASAPDHVQRCTPLLTVHCTAKYIPLVAEHCTVYSEVHSSDHRSLYTIFCSSMVHHRSRYTVQRSTFLRSRSTVHCSANHRWFSQVHLFCVLRSVVNAEAW